MQSTNPYKKRIHSIFRTPKKTGSTIRITAVYSSKSSFNTQQCDRKAANRHLHIFQFISSVFLPPYHFRTCGHRSSKTAGFSSCFSPKPSWRKHLRVAFLAGIVLVQDGCMQSAQGGVNYLYCKCCVARVVPL